MTENYIQNEIMLRKSIRRGEIQTDSVGEREWEEENAKEREREW